MPLCDQTGVPGLVGLTHFHSSTTLGSASFISVRIRLRVSPRQSSSSAILFEMSSDADWPWFAPDFFIFSSSPFGQALRRRGSLDAVPEHVRQRPEHTGGRRPAPRLQAVAHREMCDESRGEVYGEAGVGPFLEAHW